ncbi:MAG TPA: bifunctional oligoribonuclease/PAP phosphatase NrnA [Bacteroidia bacterium]|nr:bifunctional oligoribonuclease/PAP phosphatase NrnA [Bacteroidia bacterium]
MIPQFDPEFIQQIKALLGQRRKVCITTHHRPDGDAMGSSLALYNYLKINNHDVKVVVPSSYPDFLDWLPGNDEVVNSDKQPAASKTLLEEAEVLFCLDFNAISRVEKLAPPVAASKAVKILIDHHLDPEAFCSYTFSFPTSCATCELMYYFLKAIGGNQVLNESTATCLYTGIMTDTGSFRFASMTADTHRIIAELMTAGAANFTIHEAIYDNFSEQRTRFLGYCLSEKLVVLPQYRTAYISINHAELEKFNHQTGDTEGIVNFALGIKNIRLAGFFCEKDGLIKISFRSKNGFSVKSLAANHFNGGGHTNAAGGRSFDTMEATINKFVGLLKQMEKELNS